MNESSESDRDWEPNDDSSSSCPSFSGLEESSGGEEEENIPLVGLGNNLRTRGDEELQPSSDSEDNNLGEAIADDEGKPLFIEFKESMMKNPRLIEGMKFPNVQVFRKLLREYHIKEGCTFKFIKNESKRVTVKCARDCRFRLHASPMYDEKTFQIKKINQQHKCNRVYTNNNATSSWLSEKYLPKISDAPETKVKSMKNIFRREWKLDVSKHKVYRAKRKALQLIQGDYREQYLRLRDYCHMVLHQNPGSLAKLAVEPREGEAPLFQRMFISYAAQVKGFLAGCRPIIGLDACFLKGPFGGQLMHAVARDANNQMFPLAFAIVEAETKDSWTWFMELLETLIGNLEEKGWCFISDRQKGLTQTFAMRYPNVEHRYCIRHMYANFSKLFKGKEWKDLMWQAASAYTVQDWMQKMIAIRDLDQNAYSWLMSEDPKTWARCMFSTRTKCNRMDNNTSEAFNQAIKEARDQPILTMVESIRRYLMTRLQGRLKLCMGWDGNICPRIVKKIEKTTNLMADCEVIYSGGTTFEVLNVLRSFVVDIGTRTCTCRKWDVCGIPCMHGMAAIISDRSDPMDYIDECFYQSTFAKTYSFCIKPIPDQTMWLHSESDPISPPSFRAKSGRPKKNRKKGPDEPRDGGGVRKHYTNLKCSRCKQPEHNTRTCTQQIVTSIGSESGRGDQGVIGGESGRGYQGGIGRGRARGSSSTSGTTAAFRGKGKVSRGRGRMGDTSRGTQKTARNTTANNSLVVRGRGPHQGIVVGRGRAVVSEIGKGKAPAITPRIAPNTSLGCAPGLRPKTRFGGASRGTTVIGVRGKSGLGGIGTSGIGGRGTTGGGPNTIFRGAIGGTSGVRGRGTTGIGGRGTTLGIAPRVGLSIPQGSIRNAICWPQSSMVSSAASCRSGSASASASDNATMRTAPKQDSQGASSTPNTQKSAT